MKVHGRDKFDKQIAALPAAVRDEIRKALQVSATETVDVMRRFAPSKTGALRASIDFAFGAPKEGASVLSSASRSAKGDAGLAVTMFAGDERAYYAGFVEFGTKPHVNKGRFAGSQHPGTTAQPFFYPGYRFGKKRAKSRLGRAIRQGAKKAFGS